MDISPDRVGHGFEQARRQIIKRCNNDALHYNHGESVEH